MTGDVGPTTDRTEPLFRATTQEDESVAQMLALLDAQDGLPSARRLHDWAIDLAAVRSGDQVVDLGSGTGTMSRQLAGLVAQSGSTEVQKGWVTGVEPNARLRSVAASRAEANGVSNISFIDGLAGALPVADSSIDLVWCNISAIRKERSMTSPECCVPAVVPCCWIPITEPGSSLILILTC